ncbi:uncharacterized protein EI97DRAFT_239297 [Westerdykella ornata]|uniref:Uncharacterized protein n=1 Tax=Westerdykella ornata TaxID=318751 RepID=A0A6A6J6G9_WESOR|nr:uncharacterized protein EI97DRAFT_239297 [Westerdykella ornata]KAF2271992.1 hypothetical protein EI97DRAFT_239297 [Westerdykella ornata]
MTLCLLQGSGAKLTFVIPLSLEYLHFHSTKFQYLPFSSIPNPFRYRLRTALSTPTFEKLTKAFMGNAYNVLSGIGQEMGKRAGTAAREQLGALGEEVGKRAGPVTAEAWNHLATFGQDAGKHVGSAAQKAQDWIVEHLREAAAIAASIVAPPVAAGLAGPIIGAAGFGSGGVVAGSMAAGIQSSIGNVAAGSAFAFLQSAGAGGAAAGTLFWSVFGATSAAAWGATAPGLSAAAREGRSEGESRDGEPDDEGAGKKEDQKGSEHGEEMENVIMKH